MNINRRAAPSFSPQRRLEPGTARPGRKHAWMAWILVGLGLALFILANGHLVYVAVRSQPDCVTHLQTKGVAPGQFRAAKSDC